MKFKAKIVQLFIIMLASVGASVAQEKTVEQKQNSSSKKSYLIGKEEFSMFGNRPTSEQLKQEAVEQGILTVGKTTSIFAEKHKLEIIKQNRSVYVQIFGLEPDAESVDFYLSESDTEVFLAKGKVVETDVVEVVFPKSGKLRLVAKSSEKQSRVFSAKVAKEESPLLLMPAKIIVTPGQVLEITGENFNQETIFYFGAKKFKPEIVSTNSLKITVPGTVASGVIRVRNKNKLLSNGILYSVKPAPPKLPE